MKVTIDGHEVPSVPISDWTYEEADEVCRVTGRTVGQVTVGVLQGDAMSSLAFAVVGFMRTRAGEDPLELRKRKIDEIVVDFSSDGEADADGPPADAAPAAARRTRRKS